MQNTSHFLKWSIWILAAVFYFYEYVLRVSPSVMVPELMTSFGITASTVGVLSAFFLYGYAPMQLPVGILMDRFGIKKVLSLASIFCGIGAIIFSISQSFSLASLGRLLIGGSSAFAFIAMVYITSHWFPLKKRAFLIGVANSLAMLGAFAGTGPLTWAVTDFGWKPTIACFGFFGIILGIVLYLILRSDKHNVEVEKETSHIKSHILEKLKQVTSKKGTWVNAFIALFFYMTTTAFGGLWGSSFIQTAYGVSKEVAGFAVSMVFFGWLVGGPLTGLLSDFLQQRKIPIRVGIIGTLICISGAIYFTNIPIAVLYILLFLVGLFSSAELLNFSLAIELNSVRSKATAVAFTNFMISLGDSIVQPFVGILLDLNWDGTMQNGIRMYTTSDYQIALSCLPIVLIFAFLLLFFIKEEPHKHANE